MFERFTREARRVVERAETEARELGSAAVEAEHLLLALTESAPMRRVGIDRSDVLAALEREHERALAAAGVDAGAFDAPVRPLAVQRRVAFGSSAKLALERTLEVVLARGERRIAQEHVLLGVLAAPVGTVPRALRAAGLDASELAGAAAAALEPG